MRGTAFQLGLLAAFGSWSVGAIKLSDRDARLEQASESEEASGRTGGTSGGNPRRRRTPVVNVRAFDCSAHNGPLQVMNGDNGKYAVFSVDASTGEYTKIFDVPSTKTLNACAINPWDSKIYCITESYVVRIDKTRMNYVAKLAQASKAATFTSDGTFFYEGAGYSGLYKVSGLDSLKEYSDENANDLTDFSDDDEFAGNIEGAQDLTVVKGSFEGESVKEYIVALNVVWNTIVVSADIGKLWTLTVSGDKSEGYVNGFGSGYSLDNRVFFTEDAGAGTFEVADFNLDKSTASLRKVGPSGMISTNGDGMQCPSAKLPPKWAEATTTTTMTTTVTTTVTTKRDNPVAPQGKCLVGFVGKPPCSCETSVRCNKCSKKIHCSGRASAVTSDEARSKCICTCEPGWGGDSCNTAFSRID